MSLVEDPKMTGSDTERKWNLHMKIKLCIHEHQLFLRNLVEDPKMTDRDPARKWNLHMKNK